MAKCAERADDWAVVVSGRLQGCIDLVAEEAIYHKMCHSRFVNGLRCISGVTESTSAMKAFEVMCYKLETTCEKNMFTLQDLHDLMTGLCDGDTEKDLYSVKHMKRLLQERYGQSIVFAEIGGRKNVVCFRNLCNLIVSDKWHSERDVDESMQREKIVKDAALLITSEIREMSCSMDVYPTTDDISEINQELIPPLLKLFIKSYKVES